jgi:hypothetical protein
VPHNGYSHNLQSPLKGFAEGYQRSSPVGTSRQLQNRKVSISWRRKPKPVQPGSVWFRELLYGGVIAALLENIEYRVESNLAGHVR